MRVFYVFATMLVLMTACTKVQPEEELPPEEPSGGKVYFSWPSRSLRSWSKPPTMRII